MLSRAKNAEVISYHIDIVVLKRQNRLKVETHKPKLKVKMQSLSDYDVRVFIFLRK